MILSTGRPDLRAFVFRTADVAQADPHIEGEKSDMGPAQSYRVTHLPHVQTRPTASRPPSIRRLAPSPSMPVEPFLLRAAPEQSTVAASNAGDRALASHGGRP
jgi:hypothetical protein